jgi:hypothetical protein
MVEAAHMGRIMIAGVMAAIAFAIGFLLGALERSWRAQRQRDNAHTLATAVRELLRSLELNRDARRTLVEQQRYAHAWEAVRAAMSLYDADRATAAATARRARQP